MEAKLLEAKEREAGIEAMEMELRDLDKGFIYILAPRFSRATKFGGREVRSCGATKRAEKRLEGRCFWAGVFGCPNIKQMQVDAPGLV
ncbi:hypothetical protein SLA2020_509700 [Shorea laevis]